MLLIGLVLLIGVFATTWVFSARDGHPHRAPSAFLYAMGTVTLFFDSLGIGNFAPTTAILRMTRSVKAELIPGTLNVGSSIPVAVEAFAFITVIVIEPTTLVSMVVVGAAGGWLGARIVSGLPRRPLLAGMGVALLAGAVMMAMTNLDLLPGGGDAVGLSGALLGLALVANFGLGMLEALGIGSYAPSLVLLPLLGMDPRAAFPIMMGSAAYIIPTCGIRFARGGRYDGRASLGMTLGGVPGVLLAAYVVRSLPLQTLRWLVVLVVLYAASSMLMAAARGEEAGRSTGGILAEER